MLYLQDLKSLEAAETLAFLAKTPGTSEPPAPSNFYSERPTLTDNMEAEGSRGAAQTYTGDVKVKDEEEGGVVVESSYTDNKGQVWDTVRIKEELSDEDYDDADKIKTKQQLSIKQEDGVGEESPGGKTNRPGQVIHTGEVQIHFQGPLPKLLSPISLWKISSVLPP